MDTRSEPLSWVPSGLFSGLMQPIRFASGGVGENVLDNGAAASGARLASRDAVPLPAGERVTATPRSTVSRRAPPRTQTVVWTARFGDAGRPPSGAGRRAASKIS